MRYLYFALACWLFVAFELVCMAWYFRRENWPMLLLATGNAVFYTMLGRHLFTRWSRRG